MGNTLEQSWYRLLLDELDKVNKFYLSQESILARHCDLLGKITHSKKDDLQMETTSTDDSSIEEIASDIQHHLVTYNKDTPITPEMMQDSQQLMDKLQPTSKISNQMLLFLFRSFWTQLEIVRYYVVLNYMTVYKIIKKRNKHLPDMEPIDFLQLLLPQPFYKSKRIAKVIGEKCFSIFPRYYSKRERSTAFTLIFILFRP
jgi:hypothetical protein